MLGEKGKKIATTPVIKNMIDRTPKRPFVSISKTHCRLYLKHRELIEIFEQEKIYLPNSFPTGKSYSKNKFALLLQTPEFGVF